jgi:transcriptional regulator with XRE-family HTH domain
MTSVVEEQMPKLVGPTIPRWQLGETLRRLRQDAGMSEADAAKALRCSESKIRRFEGGGVGMKYADVVLLLQAYRVEDEVRRAILDLHAQSAQRGWWTPYGQVPARFSQFLSLESSAISIRIFETVMVPGLLQTEAYARASDSANTPGITPEEVERQVQLRMERQQHVLADPPELWVILDEAVLHRPGGGPAVMAEQLEHLARVARTREPGGINLHVVPFSHGPYQGQLGPFTIFGYEEDQHSPVVHVGGQEGSVYMNDEKDVSRCTIAYNQMTAAALSGAKSAELIEAVARQHAEAARVEE